MGDPNAPPRPRAGPPPNIEELVKRITVEIWPPMEKAFDFFVKKVLQMQYDALNVLYNIRITQLDDRLKVLQKNVDRLEVLQTKLDQVEKRGHMIVFLFVLLLLRLIPSFDHSNTSASINEADILSLQTLKEMTAYFFLFSVLFLFFKFCGFDRDVSLKVVSFLYFTLALTLGLLEVDRCLELSVTYYSFEITYYILNAELLPASRSFFVFQSGVRAVVMKDSFYGREVCCCYILMNFTTLLRGVAMNTFLTEEKIIRIFFSLCLLNALVIVYTIATCELEQVEQATVVTVFLSIDVVRKFKEGKKYITQ
mmetsp:Transcript_3371/g.11428  ORF Transcript_3371/g.11428 Transcript_3371/m.11428 type:complete len:310 (+) Transcript_3371:723-1652(+)